MGFFDMPGLLCGSLIGIVQDSGSYHGFPQLLERVEAQRPARTLGFFSNATRGSSGGVRGET
jgi:hypothetical protein